MIEVKKFTRKSKAWNELCDLVWKGKELTVVWDGVNYFVNEKDNDYFMNMLEWIGNSNYVKNIDEYNFTRNNRIMERMTIKEINTLVREVKSKLEKYEKMSYWHRKVIAASNKMNHYNKLIREYEEKIELNKVKYRSVYMQSIKKMKDEIKQLENMLVTKSA